MSSLQEKATFNSKLIIGILSLITIGVSIYLTGHFYEVHFPTTLGGGGLCDINSFLNCDSATNSPFSNIMGTPIALFGVIIGLLFLSGIVFQQFELDGTVITIGSINFAGCLILFLYSLISLGSLCPFCTLYYILSGIILFLYYKNTAIRSPQVPHMAIFVVLFAVALIAGKMTYQGKVEDQLAIKDDLIKQFNGLEPLAEPHVVPPFSIVQNTQKFDEAPIQLVIFSDFQCPACKALSKMIHPMMKRYKKKININYYFYPLDPSCNKEMKRALHPLACKAAYLSYCLPRKFTEVHDVIFDNQKNLSLDWLSTYAKNENVSDCMNSEETRNRVVEIVNQGNEFGIKSTPTFLLNNIKIEGVLPLSQMYILMDELVRKHEQKTPRS